MSRVENLVAQYEGTIGKSGARNWLLIERVLVTEHEWTEEGAASLLHLVREYGSFMLGNAYALALLLGVEDGEAGF